MEYRPVLLACEDPNVGVAVDTAVAQLFEKESDLLEIDAAERAIASRIAVYLQPSFEGYHINVDYNRMGDAPKRVVWNEKPDLVYPDIIVHIRQTDTNMLAIELKKDSNPEPKDDDIKKLRAYRRELLYRHALFIRFGVRENAGSVSECEWVDP